jgi:branched-chain amino acid transport system substrate-binding protein
LLQNLHLLSKNEVLIVKKQNKIYLTIGIVAVIVIVAIIMFSTPKAEETIKIGFIGPLTGPVANPGVYVKNSFELANSQYNTIDGNEVKVFYEDGKCIPSEGVSAASKLLNVDQVDIVVSAICGGSMLAIAPLTQEKEIILISSVSSTPAISDAGDYVFRISSSADLFAEKTASMIEKLGIEKVGIVVENTEYAVGWKNSFIDMFKGTITGTENFNTGDTDVKTQLIKIKNSDPDAILFLVQSPISASLLVKQAKELNIETQMIGNEAFFTRQVVKNLMGDAAEGLLILTYKYELGSVKMQQFLDDYRNSYGEDIPEEIYGAQGYDTYMVIHDALKKCGKADSNCIRDYLYSVKEQEGVSGIFSIDDKGDGIRDLMWWQVKGSEIVPYE